MKNRLVACVPLLLVATMGCASGTLPPRLSAAESRLWAGTHLNYTVGVESFQWPAYSNGLLAALRGTHLFINVKPLDQCATPPTLIARIEDPYNGGVATIPVVAFLTLGIVPTVLHEGYGYKFSLRFSNDEQRRYDVQYIFHSTTTLGWLALFEGLSPDVGWWVPEQSDRFYGRFALAILDRLPSTHP